MGELRGPADPPLGYRVVARLLQAGIRLARWRVDAQGYDHVPTTGGAVLTWNHTGHLDFAVTALPLLQRTGRWVRLLALRDLWDSWLWGWAPRIGHCVPVRRDSPEEREDALHRAVEALRAGDLVMVAPEGTISESLDLLPFRTGAVRMARAAGVPIVPTASWGSHRLATTGRRPSLRRAWRLPVVVRVGAPVHVGASDDDAAATERLRRRTQELLDVARAAHPGQGTAPQDNQ